MVLELSYDSSVHAKIKCIPLQKYYGLWVLFGKSLMSLSPVCVCIRGLWSPVNSCCRIQPASISRTVWAEDLYITPLSWATPGQFCSARSSHYINDCCCLFECVAHFFVVTPGLLSYLFFCCRQVCLFLKRGANQNAADVENQTPLSIAVKTANADIVTLWVAIAICSVEIFVSDKTFNVFLCLQASAGQDEWGDAWIWGFVLSVRSI